MPKRRIYLVLCEEEIRGRKVVIVSHGTDLYGNNEILSCDPLEDYKARGAKFDTNQGAWYVE